MAPVDRTCRIATRCAWAVWGGTLAVRHSSLDILNLFDTDDFDMAYFYESQLPGEPAPVEDIHFHPVHPQTAVLSVKAKY
ncbi:MAG: TonB-dependent nickel receptor NicT [Pseudomonadota bacterium]|jgi:hypothetical protein